MIKVDMVWIVRYLVSIFVIYVPGKIKKSAFQEKADFFNYSDTKELILFIG